MTAFMITMFVLHLLSVGSVVSELLHKEFPYQQEKTYTGAWASLFVGAGFAIWAGMLLLG